MLMKTILTKLGVSGYMMSSGSRSSYNVVVLYQITPSSFWFSELTQNREIRRM